MILFEFLSNAHFSRFDVSCIKVISIYYDLVSIKENSNRSFIALALFSDLQTL